MGDYLVVCAWCGKLMRTVGKPPATNPDISHGMCAACDRRDAEEYGNHEPDSDDAQPHELGRAAG
jgi:hypothetical protein